MNRSVFLSLFYFLGLVACQSKHSRHSSDPVGPDSTIAVVKETAISPDTSLLSLKASGAVSVRDVLAQGWKLEDADRTHWNEIFWDSSEDKRQFPELALFRDLTVTENARCGIRMGKWELNKEKSELYLHFANGRSKTYIVRKIAMKQMELVWQKGRDSAIIQLSAPAIVHKRPLDDPFHPLNNQWRIKPLAPESNEQLRQRIKEYTHFYSLFFWDNHQREEKDISFSGLPCCFVWYNGGIGMQSRIELDKRWINCFYSESQAFKAYDMLADLLGSHTLKWAEHPTSWIAQTADVLGQMAGKL